MILPFFVNGRFWQLQEVPNGQDHYVARILADVIPVPKDPTVLPDKVASIKTVVFARKRFWTQYHGGDRIRSEEDGMFLDDAALRVASDGTLVSINDSRAMRDANDYELALRYYRGIVRQIETNYEAFKAEEKSKAIPNPVKRLMSSLLPARKEH